MKSLYDKASGVLRVCDKNTASIKLAKGVKQGCLISLILFNAIEKKIMGGVKEQPHSRAEKNLEEDKIGL